MDPHGPGKRTAGADSAYLSALLMPEEETVFCLFDGGKDDVRRSACTGSCPSSAHSLCAG